jgi:type IV pilus assembly protein PilF
VKLALAAKPDLPAAHNLQGLIYAALGDDKQAEDSYRRALQLAPRDGDTLHNYGWLLCQQKRHADADAQFQQALALPQYANAARTLMAQGICLARAGHLERAEATLVRSYEIDATNPVTAVNLAEVLLRRGDYERARFYIRRINSQPDLSNAQTLWLATRIEHKLGNQNGVATFGKQLRDRFPQSREAFALQRGAFDE